MKELHLRVDALQSICANSNIVGMGSCGVVFQLDDETLFKFNYKDFIEYFAVDENKIDVRQLMDITDAIDSNKEIEDIVYKGKGKDINNIIRKAGKKQSQMQLNFLTKGFVYCRDYCVGYLLHNHKNMVNLFDYILQNGLSDVNSSVILTNIRKAVAELMQNNIYHYDMTARNILFDPKSCDIRIIDFEDQIRVFDSPDEKSVAKMQKQMSAMEQFFQEYIDGYECIGQ